MTDLIYLDHHATTPLDPRVLEAMLPWWTTQFGNAHSISHQSGLRAAEAVARSRETIAGCLGCTPEEIIFTSGATEANNLAIKGLSNPHVPGRFVTNAAEHRAVLDPFRRLRRQGGKITILPVDDVGRIRAEEVIDALDENTQLVSVMLANNEVGTLNPVREIAEACHDRQVLVHSDASQAIGKIAVSLRELPVELMSFTAHKIYGPQGIGALFVRRGARRIPLQPLLDGGGHERGLRSGTLPIALIVGFAKAVEIAVAELSGDASRITGLRDELWQMLSAKLPGVQRNGDPIDGLPGNLNITIPNIDGDVLLAKLAKTRLCVSSGAACSSANPEPSHVLRAMGRSDSDAKASLRFGLGRFTTMEEIHAAAGIALQAIQDARR